MGRRSSYGGFNSQKDANSNKYFDVSFEDYKQTMSKANIAPDLNEAFIYKDLSKKAANLLNNSVIKIELQKEAVRRRIERIRWQHQGLINVNPTLTNGTKHEELIDNPLRGTNEALTLSVFSRPCLSQMRQSFQGFSGMNQHSRIDYGATIADDKTFSLTTAKGLFNPKVLLETQKKFH